MNNRRLRFLIILGLIAISGVIITQLFWLKAQYRSEELKFHQKIHVGLLGVVEKLYQQNSEGIPLTNPVKQISDDYYIVNINYDIHPQILDYHLKTEFEKLQINTDFEYAVYDCETDEMVYGNYVSGVSGSRVNQNSYFPKFDNLVYYFAIRFPNRNGYLFNSLGSWIIISGILILILAIYTYSAFTLLRQKKYSELQRDFINNMTHEFKTPLSSILIAANYLHGQTEISQSEKLKKYTKAIIEQSKRLNSQVEKVLDLAKSEKSPIKLNRIKINAVDQLKTIVESFQVQYGDKLSISLISQFENVNILADEIHFTNLIYNLIDNAIKYSDNKPEIFIELKTENNELLISVKDHGRGIDSRHQKHIFQKFYRIPSSDNDPIHGFGLGLFYVKRICQLHMWKIRLTSKPRGGSTFHLLIPNES